MLNGRSDLVRIYLTIFVIPFNGIKIELMIIAKGSSFILKFQKNRAQLFSIPAYQMQQSFRSCMTHQEENRPTLHLIQPNIKLSFDFYFNAIKFHSTKIHNFIENGNGYIMPVYLYLTCAYMSNGTYKYLVCVHKFI